MKTREELQAFCEGYVQGLTDERAFYGTPLSGCDDWVIWGGYDINFVGQDYTSEALGDAALLAVVSPAGWEGNLPDHLYTFTVTSTNQERLT